ncbi:MAG: helix-turn-helix domain-containing protein [Alphaproteobacteria bacterium]|nr:helix-turn-helix domain-containing protein [Alphaproteobacteria bacterium]
MVKSARDGAGTFTRGRLSKRTGCNIETIRYYESIGLVPDPPRTAGRHRVYGEEHLKRLTFICRSRELGFSLSEIRSLLALVDGGDSSCAEVQALTLAHVGDVKRKIADLRRMERVLSAMAVQCEDDEIPECPIIDALFEDKSRPEL